MRGAENGAAACAAGAVKWSGGSRCGAGNRAVARSAGLYERGM